VASDERKSVVEEGAGDAPRSGWRGIRRAGLVLLAAKLALLVASVVGSRVVPATAQQEPPAAAQLAVVRPRAGAAPAQDAQRAQGPGDVQSLLESLSRRQTVLEARERELAAREESLALYEKDVSAKVQRLEQVAESLKQEIGRVNAAADESAESLAKVYGTMKPAAAAPLLDQLDEATALRILTRMKEKQVGEILPLMSRERALVLTRVLAGERAAKPQDAPRPPG
jgi:flagellar motility protein MotE (MotC chaperone)